MSIVKDYNSKVIVKSVASFLSNLKEIELL